MAAYRYQVVSVGMWRGKIKRWNTTVSRAQSSFTSSVLTAMLKSGYKAPGDVVGACSGGVASIAVYAPTGGTPLSNTIYFDWETPSTWIPYTGEVWASIDPATPLDAAGESAVVVRGRMAALSASGKPVFTRKYLHAVPSRTGPTFADPDVPAAVKTALESVWTTNLMTAPSGIVPVSTEAEEWYGSHQRVRGRRRTVASVAAQSFSLGVLAGGGATTSGQGEPFPGGEF